MGFDEQTSHEVDHVIDRQRRGEDERDREGMAVLPPRIADPEDFHRVQDRYQLLAAVWAGGVVVWDTSGHQEELETR